MLDLEKIHKDVLDAIVNNLDLEEDRDKALEEIAEMSAVEAFSRYCTWQGFVDWGPALTTALDNLRAAERSAAGLHDWEVEIEGRTRAHFKHPVGVIRVNVTEDGRLYINAANGNLIIQSDSGNAIYLDVTPIGTRRVQPLND